MSLPLNYPPHPPLSPATTALVVFSGGQDSTTCLHYALRHFPAGVEAVFFDYGQRHLCEKESALLIAKRNQIKLHIHNIPFFSELGGNALTRPEIAIEQKEQTLPTTFVPGRNLVFLTLAASLAYTLKISHLVTGVCQTDFSGYPDCRQNTLNLLQETLNAGMEYSFTLHTPLMYLTKAQTVQLAHELGPQSFADLSFTHTCYEGHFPPCGLCPACLLRAKGFQEAGLPDPLLERALKQAKS